MYVMKTRKMNPSVPLFRVEFSRLVAGDLLARMIRQCRRPGRRRNCLQSAAVLRQAETFDYPPRVQRKV